MKLNLGDKSLQKKLKDALDEFNLNLEMQISRVAESFRFDLDFIERTVKNNTKAGWPLTPNFDMHLYQKMGADNISDEERNNVFVRAYKDNILESEWDQIIRYTFGGWKEVLNEAKELYFSGKYKVLAPLFFSYLEAYLVHHTPEKPEEISKQLVEEFSKKYIANSKLKMDCFLLESNKRLLTDFVYKRGFFGKKEPFFNRNCVLHGRYDPSQWKEIDVIKIIAILSSLTFIKESTN